MMLWILCLALFAGTTASVIPEQALQAAEIQPKNITVLQRFPSIVQIEFYLFWSIIDWSQECAGSILTSRFILSAASCFDGWYYEPRFRRIRAGSWSRRTGGVVIYVQDRINHPRWAANDYSGDVSLVRTISAIVYSPVIAQASVASPGSWIPNGLQLSQPGWRREPALNHQLVVTAARSNCNRIDGNFSTMLNATQNILCAIPPPPSANASNADVGSPWIFNNTTVGIVGGVNTLDIYRGLIGADVGQYTEWVINTVSTWW